MAHTSYDPRDKQRTFSEDTIKIREHSISHKDKLPIQMWNPLERPSNHLGVASYGGKTDDAISVYNYLGATDVKLESITVDQPRTSVHVYNEAYIDRVSATTGEHYINKGGYVADLQVSGDSIIHIYGHIGTLAIEGSAQVYCYENCYVDTIIVQHGGFVRVDKGAFAHYLHIYKEGKATVHIEASIYKLQAEPGAQWCHVYDENVKPYRVSIFFKDRTMALNFCTWFTVMYNNHYQAVEFGDMFFKGISRCLMLPADKGYEVEFSAETCNRNKIDQIKEAIQKHSPYKGDVTVWLNGKNELELKYAAIIKEEKPRSPEPMKRKGFWSQLMETNDTIKVQDDLADIHAEWVSEFGEELAAKLEKYIDEKAKDPKVIALFERAFGKAK